MNLYLKYATSYKINFIVKYHKEDLFMSIFLFMILFDTSVFVKAYNNAFYTTKCPNIQIFKYLDIDIDILL